MTAEEPSEAAVAAAGVAGVAAPERAPEDFLQSSEVWTIRLLRNR